MASEWCGNDQNGVEVRKNDDDTVDEVLLYVEGKAVAVLEQMDHGHWWMGFYAREVDMVTINLASPDSFEIPINALVEQS